MLALLCLSVVATQAPVLPPGAKRVEWRSTNGWVTRAGVISNSGPSPEHLFSKEEHGDANIHVEFRIPKGSNSGVYVKGEYEIQIFDSFGKAPKDLRFSDCGAIYERFIEPNGPGYEGKPPTQNPFRGPDTWNAFDIQFRAPRFDAAGKKTENARLIEVKLNGVVIHKNVDLTGPTRGGFLPKEAARGPIILQGDHGPVSFRNVWIQPAKY